MKNRKQVYKISLTIAVVLSIICNFLPIINVSTFFSKYSLSTIDFFNMNMLEELGGLSSDVNYITLFKGIFAILMVLNLLALLCAWFGRNKYLNLVGALGGVVQTGFWIFMATAMLTSPELKELFQEGALSIGIATWGFILCGIVILVMSTLLISGQDPTDKEQAEGGIIGISGEYAGARIPVGKSPVVIGRDQNSSNVILADNRISRQHCSIVYDAARKMYIVRDFSSNGTFMQDGTRLKSNQINELPSGTQIRVGDKNVFALQ